MPLTPELTRAFWAHMQTRFDVSVEEKNDSLAMQAIATLLDALSVQERDRFMKDFVTTIVTVDATVYVPFEIGVEVVDGNVRWPLWNQCRVAVHECQHAVQARREGWVAFDSKYLSSGSYRAGYEAEAFGCDLEMEFWRQGAAFDLATFVQERPLVLKGYNCSEENIEQARAMLAVRAGVVAQGVVETEAAIVAIDWFENHVPDVRLVQ